MPRQELPAIDDRTCTACEDCVRLCPTACLTLPATVPVVEPAACISCGVCRDVCPVNAITMIPHDW